VLSAPPIILCVVCVVAVVKTAVSHTSVICHVLLLTESLRLTALCVLVIMDNNNNNIYNYIKLMIIILLSFLGVCIFFFHLYVDEETPRVDVYITIVPIPIMQYNRV